MFCWGWNVGGQVGDGMIANRLTPFEVAGIGWDEVVSRLVG